MDAVMILQELQEKYYLLKTELCVHLVHEIGSAIFECVFVNACTRMGENIELNVLAPNLRKFPFT